MIRRAAVGFALDPDGDRLSLVAGDGNALSEERTVSIAVDFVHHGDEGVAGPWAAAARPGDTIGLFGPGGGYAPNPAADRHLLAGDTSALPAISAACAACAASVEGRGEP